jgi:DGQHR domain-containing protein
MVIPIVDNPSKDPEKAVVSIVDGQHRIYGISEAFRENWLSQNDEVAIPVSVVFADEGNAADPLLEEAQQFLTLNNEQKRVRTDLAHQLILRREGAVHGSVQDDTKIPTGLTGKELLPYVTAVVNRLSEQSASPWYDRIVRPNSLRNTTGWPSQGQFEDSLLDNYLGLGSAASWAAGASLTTGELVRVISNYWSAIFELCPEPLTTPEEYVLTKTAGIHALNGLLPALFTKRRNLPMVPTTKAFKDVLATMDGVFTEEYWSSAKGEAASYGTSKKSFKELCRAISETITSTA